MNEPAVANGSRPAVNAVPEIREPCPWCTEPAVVTFAGSQWTLSCPACSVAVEVNGATRRGRVPRHPIPAAA